MVNTWYIIIPATVVLTVAAFFVLSTQRRFDQNPSNVGGIRGIVESKVDSLIEQEKSDFETLSKQLEAASKQQSEQFAALESTVKANQEKISEVESKVEKLESNVDKILRNDMDSVKAGADGQQEHSQPRPTASVIDPGKIIDDFTSCKNFAVKQVKQNFAQSTGRKYEMVRLGFSEPCQTGTTDIAVFFTWRGVGDCLDEAKSKVGVQYWKKGESSVRMQIDALMSGCFVDDKERTWRFFTARLGRLQPDTEYLYMLEGERLPRLFMSPPLPGASAVTSLVIAGDTKIPAAQNLMSAFAKYTGFHDLVVHVGDGTYATNSGECYAFRNQREANANCGWNCTGVHCAGVNRMSAEMMDRIQPWVDAFDSTIQGRMAWMTTMGNHDNDLQWFLTQRPVVASALPGVHTSDIHYDSKESITKFAHSNLSMKELMALAFEYMKMPHFYSFDFGKVHVVSIGSEDNPNNAYEQFNGEPLTDELKQRFEKHFGRNSRQFQWLIKDLSDANTRRAQVPWILLFTHRPLYHTSSHHPSCGLGGDWFVCMFRETYEPILRQFGVNMVMTGHSHHYSRSHPMYQGKVDQESGTVHCTIGTGGFDLTNGFLSKPEWIAYRTGTQFGYVRINFENATHAKWQFLSPKADGSSDVIEETWIHRTA